MLLSFRPDSSLIDDFNLFDSSFTSGFSFPKFDIDAPPFQDDKRYMGICLPKVLMEIFPAHEETRDPKFLPDSIAKNPIDTSRWKHSRKHCFVCSQIEQSQIVEYIDGKFIELKNYVINSKKLFELGNNELEQLTIINLFIIEKEYNNK